MRISQLSERAGLPVGTVKFYLRTGLLHHGRATSATQAIYDESHVERLRLVRALLDIGKLSHAEIQKVLDALQAPAEDGAELLQTLATAVAPEPSGPVDLVPARDLVAALGWTVADDSPHLRQLARTLCALDALGVSPEPGRLKAYADAAALLARDDVDAVAAADEELRALVATAGVVLFDTLFSTLRRLATEAQAVPRTGRVPSPRTGSSVPETAPR